MISATDEERHAAGAGELWNESYYFNFFDAREKIGGFLRIGLQERLRKSNVWCLLIRGGRKAYQRFLLDLPCPETRLADGLSAGGLSFRMLEPLERFQLGFADADTELDLLWEALHPVVELGGEGGGLPENLASAHYEQSGLVTGRFAVKGERFDFQGNGSRDHSWGIRDWARLRGWIGVWPVFGEDFLFSCGRVFLPDGGERKVGFVFDGEQNLEIGDSELEAEFAGDGHTPTRVRLTLTDEKDRSAEVEGRLIANFPLPYDGNILNEAMFEYRMGERLGYGLCEHFVGL
jgi:hypothetical protein